MVNGVFPSKKEKEFLAKYNRWLAANVWWEKQKAKPDGSDTSDQPAPAPAKQDPAPSGQDGGSK